MAGRAMHLGHAFLCLSRTRHIQGLFNAQGLGTEAKMKHAFALRSLRIPAIVALAGAALASASLVCVPAHPVQADEPGGEQGQARKARQAGNILSIRQIEGIVLPRMSGMQYLGPEYDPAAMAYRLKFIQNGKVYFVDVDARTGRIIGQSR